jgi:hypothetical protein
VQQCAAATMAERLFFEQRKTVLKWYWKYENIKEVQRQWKNEFAEKLAMLVTIIQV